MLSTMDHITTRIRELLEQNSAVDFAVLFGSVVRGKTTPLSDIDVGVSFTVEPSLLDIGGLVAQLESRLDNKVDVVELNGLYRTRPVFAYQIASQGVPVFFRDYSRVVDFKRNSFLYYFDTAPLRKQMNAALVRRIASGRFGKRNYVG